MGMLKVLLYSALGLSSFMIQKAELASLSTFLWILYNKCGYFEASITCRYKDVFSIQKGYDPNNYLEIVFVIIMITVIIIIINEIMDSRSGFFFQMSNDSWSVSPTWHWKWRFDLFSPRFRAPNQQRPKLTWHINEKCETYILCMSALDG